MGRKRADKRDDDETEDLPSIPGQEQEIDDRALRDIDDVLQEVGSGATVRIFRIADNGVPALAGKLKVEDFSVDTLIDYYGGGSYLLKFFRGNELIEKVPFDVDPSIPARNPKGQQPQQTNNGNTDLLSTVLAGQAESNRRTTELMTTMLAGFATAMTTMMQASRENRPEPQNPMEMLRTAVELTRPTTPTKSAIAELKELMELRDMLEPEGESDDDGTMRLVGKAIDTVGEIVKRNPPARRGPVSSPLAGQPVAVVAAGETVAEEKEMRLWMKGIQSQLPILRLAIGTMSPETAATVIGNELEDDAFGDLVQDITDGLSEGTTVTPESFRAFADRTMKALMLPEDKVDWLTQVAFHVVQIANETLADENAHDNDDK